ncbi:MAG: hypothetical protein Q4F60_02585 [Candidatus Saccharibacteria bacterium]|nr:hypothetical protein [Candidatus Saccharibacteria bacterium]
MSNQAFVDGQNLYMNTKANSWTVDLARFRVYLKERYDVEKAYYFLGAVDEDNQDLYEKSKLPDSFSYFVNIVRT